MKAFFGALWRVIISNWPMKVAALVFAFIIWSYVMVDMDPVRLMYVEGVSVSVVGTDQLEGKSLIAAGDLGELVGKVKVGIDAAQTLHKRINADNIKATLDLSAINTTGEAQVKITVSPTYGTVRSVEPSSVKVSIDELISREIPVSAEIIGEPIEGKYICEPALTPTAISLKGARSVVEQVAEAKVYVDAGALEKSFRESREVVLFDGEDAVINSSGGFSGGVPAVIASVDVYDKKQLDIDTDAVMRAVRGVAKGYEVTGIKIDPASLTVAAPKDVLASVTKLSPEPVDMKDAKASTLVTVRFSVPEGAVFDGGATAEAYVRISEVQEERAFPGHVITLINDGSYKAVLKPRRTKVTVSGGASAVSALSDDQIKLYVDVSALTPGSYVLPVSYESIDGITNITLADATVNVTIS